MGIQYAVYMNKCACPKDNASSDCVTLNAAQMEHLSDIFKALGHPVRLRMVVMLLEGERCVCELHAGSKRDFSTISSHLSILKNCGVVTSEQRGRNIYYRLCCPCMGYLIRCLSGE